MRHAVPSLALAFLLALAASVPVHAEDEPRSPFEDPAVLEQQLAAACDMVEAIEGVTLPARPTVKVSTPEAVAAILAGEFEALPEAMVPAEQREALAAQIARFLMAKYEPATHTIHVLPAGIRLIAKAQPDLAPLGLPHLRVLMAHEVTHALDFPRYGIEAKRAALTDVDAHQALNAVVEGHAQFVAEEAARRWKLTEAFERLTAAIAGVEDPDATDTQKAMQAAALSQIRFAYVQGHQFFTAVAKAQGRQGVERAMRTPPAKSRLVEKPALWLTPEEATDAPDLGEIAQSFAWLAGGEGWISGDQRVLESALRTQGLRVPPDRRAEWMQGFHDAHIHQAQNPSSGARVIAVVLHFDSPENAARFAELDYLIVEHAEGQAGVEMETKALEKGVGREHEDPGFYMHRVVKVMGQDVDVRQLVMAHGAFAVEMMVLQAPHIDRAHMGLAMARAFAWMDDPIAAAALPPLPTPQPAVPADEETPAPAKPAEEKPAPKEPVPTGPGR